MSSRRRAYSQRFSSILGCHSVGWHTASKYPVSANKAKQWLADNKEAIDNGNQYAQKYGLFADKHRVLVAQSELLGLKCELAFVQFITD